MPLNKPKLLNLPLWMEQYPHLTAGFSTKIGGVSRGVWDSLNVGLHVGDEADHVVQNRKRIATALGFPFAAWTCAEQTHGDRVFHVTTEHKGRGRLTREDAIPDTDALMTDEPDILLVSFYADCVPLYFYDPERNAVGLAHAGWKGTVSFIAAKTIAAMVEQLGCDASRMLGAVGPAIGPCCYEVDDRVITQFVQADLTVGIKAKPNGRYDLDLKQLNRHIMIKAGMEEHQIVMSDRCTACQRDLFYSHRRDRGQTGRMMSWIGMKNGVREHIEFTATI